MLSITSHSHFTYRAIDADSWKLLGSVIQLELISGRYWHIVTDLLSNLLPVCSLLIVKYSYEKQKSSPAARKVLKRSLRIMQVDTAELTVTWLLHTAIEVYKH